MQSQDDSPKSASQPQASLLLDQCEANEQLLLAALRAQEDAEDAHSSRIIAEDESDLLRAKAAELTATREHRERVLGIIAHDLRNPLGAMLMDARLLEEAILPARANCLAARIVASGRRMQRMIDQLADLTRAGLGDGFRLERALCDLAAICEDVVEELRLASGTEIKLTSSGPLAGRWDADSITEVLLNLVGNATGYASPQTTVFVDARGDNGGVVVDVRHERAAILPENLEKLFRPFGASHSEAGHAGGDLGSGLHISREIALAHHGRLEVQSSAASTTFSLYLPHSPRG